MKWIAGVLVAALSVTGLVTGDLAAAASGTGVRMVRDIAPGTASSRPVWLTSWNGYLFFASGGPGPLFVRSPVGDVSRLKPGVSARPFPTPDGVLFNAEYTPYDVWRSDGTAAGTRDLGFAGRVVADVNGRIFYEAPRPCKQQGLFCDPALHLWVTDGSSAGTMLHAKPINNPYVNGVRPPYVVGPTIFDGELYYVQAGGGGGLELWRTDGTDPGTERVRDINPGKAPSYPRDLTVVGNWLFFSADDGVHGRELWRTDGTRRGTQLVRDIHPGRASARPSPVVDLDGVAYFAATDGSHGAELWRSDGTRDGTSMVRDFIGSSEPEHLTVAAGQLWYSAVAGGQGRELFVSDGRRAGTRMVRDVSVGSASSNPAAFMALGRQVYFAATGSAGRELWHTDGTSNGSGLAADIYPGTQSSDPGALVPVGDDMFFTAYEPMHGRELWTIHDGQASLADDIETRPDSSNPGWIGTSHGRVCFAATSTDRAAEASVWRSDGTTAGTVSLGVPIGNPIAFNDGGTVEAAGSVYFVTQSVDKSRSTVWRTDCTSPQSTLPVRTISRNIGAFRGVTTAGGRVYAVVARGQSHYLAGFSGSTYLGDTPIAPVFPRLTPAGARLYISDGSGRGLWKVDSGVDVSEVDPAQLAGVEVMDAVAVGTRLVVRGQDSSGKGGLWITDGTVAGTNKLFSADTPDQVPWPIAAKSRAYFYVDGGGSTQLWSTDGTRAGSQPVTTLSSRPSTFPSDYAILGDELFFQLSDSSGVQLWRTDGTSSGTLELATFASIRNMTVAPGRVLFTAQSPGGAPALWESDGTTAGTTEVTQKVTAAFQPTAVAPDLIAFTAVNSTDGLELWRTDGTDAGTQPVDDTNPATANGTVILGPSVNGTLYFDASTPQTGLELWAWTP